MSLDFKVIAETPASSPLPANVNLTQIMETWTLQSGYPVVSVERSQFSNNVTFTQVDYNFIHREEDVYNVFAMLRNAFFNASRTA